MKTSLSKSTYLRGLQCKKSLYLYKHHYNQRDAIPPSTQAVFDSGHEVGELAQSLFPGGDDASPENYFQRQESVSKTADLIQQGVTTIYEAAFLYDDIFVAVDILHKDNQGWKGYEVKSSTKISDTNRHDASIQYYVIKNSGIDLFDLSIVHINNQYTREGELDIKSLFTIESVMDEVELLVDAIPDRINRLRGVIQMENPPTVDIGPHCSDPYDCDFRGTCWKHIPEYSVFDLAGLWTSRKFELYKDGIITFDQIDLASPILKAGHILQIRSELEGTSHIHEKKIHDFVSELHYPLYFLDFETINPAVPIYNGSRPYQQIVFQYSLHVQKKSNGPVKHVDYLSETNTDPRPGFIKQLIRDCGEDGDIIVYNIGFERGRLNELAEQFPEFEKPLNAIIARLKDLMIPFKEKWVYTPEMKGSYSIKAVLPALVPELSYNDLDIQEGGTASNVFLSMVNGSFEGDEKVVRQQLKAYCKMDTLAMVRILEKIETII